MNITSLECKRDGSSVCSPEELKVQWNDSAGGDASTSHFNDKVSCLRAPSNSSWRAEHTGASECKIKKRNGFRKRFTQ